MPAGTKTVFRAYRPVVGESVFKVLVSLVGIRMCANPVRSRVTGSTVHGLAKGFRIEIGRGCRAQEARNQPQPTLASKNLPSFSFRGAFGCGGRRRVRRGAQRKHGELAAEGCIVLQGGIATNGTQALGGFREPGGKTDAGPAADAGQDRNVLLAAMLIGGHVADDAGWRLELVEFLARLGINCLE